MTWSGAPERYIAASPGGKNERWLRTTSVFESFSRNSRPSARARSVSRSVISSASGHCRSFSKSSARVSTSRVAENVVKQPVHRVLPEQRGVQLHGDVEAHLLHQERRPSPRSRPPGSRGRWRASPGRRALVGSRGRGGGGARPGSRRAGPRPRPARPSSTRPRTAPRASGPRRGRSPRSGRGSCRPGRGRPVVPAGPWPARRRSASSPSRTRAGSPRAAAPGSTRRCSPRSPCRCRAAGSSRRSLTWTVFSSMKRPPASQESRTFWAICPWGPAAGPTGLAARWPCTTTDVSRSSEPAPEAACRQVEDLPLVLPLPEHPPQQVREGRRDELGHARTSARMIATPEAVAARRVESRPLPAGGRR